MSKHTVVAEVAVSFSFPGLDDGERETALAGLELVLGQLAAPWDSGEGTVAECHARLRVEFQRRMDIAAEALAALK